MTPTKLTAEEIAEIKQFVDGDTALSPHEDAFYSALFKHITAVEQERDQAQAQTAYWQRSANEIEQEYLADLKQARQALRAVEWGDEFYTHDIDGEVAVHHRCAKCLRRKSSGIHAPDCIVGKALSAEGR